MSAQEGTTGISARVVFPVIYHILEQGAVSSRRAVPTLEKTGVWPKKLAFFVGARTLGQDHRSESPTCCLWVCARGQCARESLRPPLALDRRHSRRLG